MRARGECTYGGDGYSDGRSGRHDEEYTDSRRGDEHSSGSSEQRDGRCDGGDNDGGSNRPNGNAHGGGEDGGTTR
ncbi:hypothetical protein DVH05_024456 [Phytophthora capsici]|nr:hypothetical protein DVH05_024456 [Phytophthora capsici]